MVSNPQPTQIPPKALDASVVGTRPTGVDLAGGWAITRSPIGKKLLTGLTGLGLVGFVVVHLLGNLTLFFSASAYNQIAHVWGQLGPITYLIELILGVIALLHIYIGTQIYIGKRKARPVDYTEYESAGESSRQNFSSRTMIFSGLLLGLFLIVHLSTFKFGTYYTIPGTAHRDLSRLVFETFHQPTYTAGYVVAMSLLGLHLRHGLWSALQSMGIATNRATYAASAVLGIAIALGFIGLPLAIYFGLIS